MVAADSLMVVRVRMQVLRRTVVVPILDRLIQQHVQGNPRAGTDVLPQVCLTAAHGGNSDSLHDDIAI